MLKLLDMAHYSQVTDAHAIQADGVICKATQGNKYIDPTFKDKIEAFVAAGKRVGAYAFLDPRCDPQDSAELFALTCKSVYPGPMTLMVDAETLSQGDGMDAWGGLPKGTQSAWLFKFLGRLQLHYKGFPYIYMSQNFYRQYFMGVDLSAWPLAVPDYHSEPWTPRLPDCWKEPTIWQKCEKDREPGLIGYADLDEFYGDLNRLKALECVPL